MAYISYICFALTAPAFVMDGVVDGVLFHSGTKTIRHTFIGNYDKNYKILLGNSPALVEFKPKSPSNIAKDPTPNEVSPYRGKPSKYSLKGWPLLKPY